MRIIALISALVPSVMSFIFLVGWHFQLSFLLNLPPSSWPIPYIATLCLLLSGLALFILTVSSRIHFLRILGGANFLLGFQGVIEFFFPISRQFNVILNHICHIPSSQITVSASLGFMLIGSILMFWPKNNESLFKSILLLIFSIFLIVLAATGIFINIFPGHLGHKLDRFLVHFYTAIGLFFVGLGLIISKFHRNIIDEPYEFDIH